MLAEAAGKLLRRRIQTLRCFGRFPLAWNRLGLGVGRTRMLDRRIARTRSGGVTGDWTACDAGTRFRIEEPVLSCQSEPRRCCSVPRSKLGGTRHTCDGSSEGRAMLSRRSMPLRRECLEGAAGCIRYFGYFCSCVPLHRRGGTAGYTQDSSDSATRPHVGCQRPRSMCVPRP